MVVIMKPGTKKEDIDILVRKFRDQGLDRGHHQWRGLYHPGPCG